MSQRFRVFSVLAVGLLWVGQAALEAQAFGRITVVVRGSDQKPLEGVEVSVTCKEIPKYNETKTTNKKGKAIFSFTDATKVYDFHFEYEDYQPADMPIKPPIRSTLTREVVLTEGQLVRTDGAAIIYSPAERVFNEGVVALKASDFDTARSKFLEALEKNPEMAAAHSALGGLYLESKEYEAALASTERFLELAPGEARGLRMLYEAHKGLGNDKDADAALKALSKADASGDTVAMVYNEGVAAAKVGDRTTASARFREALDLDPNLVPALVAMSLISIEEGKFQEAVGYAERHLALKPNDPQSLRVRWDAYRQLGDEEKTAVAFEELAAVDPKVLITNLYNEGNSLFDSGDIPGAIGKFELILEIDPNYARAHYRLGVCGISGGDNESAKAHLEKFIELAPDDPESQAAKDMLSYLE